MSSEVLFDGLEEFIEDVLLIFEMTMLGWLGCSNLSSSPVKKKKKKIKKI